MPFPRIGPPGIIAGRRHNNNAQFHGLKIRNQHGRIRDSAHIDTHNHP